MTHIKIMVSRHSAFYSPVIATISGKFLDKYGISASYHIADKSNPIDEVSKGDMDLGQAAVSGSWNYLESGKKSPVAHFAQINSYDGFLILSRETSNIFNWNDLKKGKFIEEKDLIALRPAPLDSIKPYEKKVLLGKKLKKNIKKGDFFAPNDVE